MVVVIEILPEVSYRVFGAVVACAEFAANQQATIFWENALDSPVPFPAKVSDILDFVKTVLQFHKLERVDIGGKVLCRSDLIQCSLRADMVSIRITMHQLNYWIQGVGGSTQPFTSHFRGAF